MTRGILVVGNEGPTVQAIAVEAKKRVQSAVFAFAPNRFGGVASPVAASRTAMAETANMVWNPASALSARTLVIGAENRLGRIDEALLVCSPLAIRRRADELLPAEIDALVEDLIKGWFFLVRELAIVFRARQAGALAMILSEVGLNGAKDEAPDLVGVAVAAAFRAFAQGLLGSSFKEAYRILAFSQSESPDDSGFAAFVFRIMDDANKRDSGRWHKFGRGGFFSLR